MRRRRAETGPFHPGRGFRPAAQSAGTCARKGAFRRPARLGDLDRSGGCRGRGRNRRILLSDDPFGAFRRSLRGPKPVGGRCRGCGRRSGNRCGGNGRKRCRCGGCRRRTGCGWCGIVRRGVGARRKRFGRFRIGHRCGDGRKDGRHGFGSGGCGRHGTADRADGIASGVPACGDRTRFDDFEALLCGAGGVQYARKCGSRRAERCVG